MRECRFFPWCSYIKDHGCTKDSCRHYQPMPDVEALLALADECGDASMAYAGDGHELTSRQFANVARRIREAIGETS